jgi:hypothetical protein
VSFAYARPEVLAFVQRLGYEYQSSCGAPLVITSVVRPISLQPRNASPLSVHPAGMAVDLHVPDQPACRSWLVQRLVAMAATNTIDVTEEKHPHHLHIAVFPRAYSAWAAKQPPLPSSVAGEALLAGRVAAASHQSEPSQPSGFGASAATVGMTLAVMALVWAALVPLARRSGRGAQQDAHS